ncbi:hypothetical protein JFT37_06035 [Pseudomonas fluorescens]|nr:hypothetical protein [Pseudomonas fluorescens]
MGRQFSSERDRAEYWKQRAKSAEGHLFSSDFKAAVMALHACTNFESTPWDELSGCQIGKLYKATGSVIRVVNARRCTRAPKDSDAEEVIRALTAELDKANEDYDKAWRHDLNDKKNYQVLSTEVVRLNAERDQFKAFAVEMINASFEGGSFDGGDIQDIAVKHGLLRIERREDECGEACACREYGFPAVCYRKTNLVLEDSHEQ